jgi:hypothetical protein
MKGSTLAACVAAAGLAAALTACGGSSASSGTPASSPSHTTSSATPASTSAALPVGYHRIGGPEQGVSLGIPSSWVSINLAQQTLQQAIRKLAHYGISQTYLEAAENVLTKLHAVYAIDTKSIIASPGHPTNINAYCATSGITETGSAGLAFLRPSVVAELRPTGATNIRQTNVVVGGTPGIQTAYTLPASLGGSHAAQLEVLPKTDRACFITLTGGAAPSSQLAQIAPTVQYP